MKNLQIAFLIFLCFQCPNCSHSNELIILEGITIIDGTGNPPIPSTSIVIREGKIIYIGEKEQFNHSEDAKILKLENRYVIPGLVEMHAHMYDSEFHEEVLKTMLAFGITTLRNPAASPVESVELRNRISAGEIIGPRMFTAGWLIDGPESISGGIEVSTEEEIREVVRKQAATGVDYIKLYTHLTPVLVKAAIEETHSLGLEVIGHLGKTSWTYAANAGIDGLLHSAMAGPTWELIPPEHRNDFRDLANPTKDFNPSLFKAWGEAFDINDSEIKELTKALRDNHVVIDPTMVMMEAMIWGNDTSYRELLEPDFAPTSICQYWRTEKLHPYTSWWTEEEHLEAQDVYPTFKSIVKYFYDHGVLLTTGTDQGNPWITPGVSLHREFELLVSAGIPPLEVVKIATSNGAEALHILQDVGTVEVGKQADLVVLSSNPLQNISNTRDIEMVIMRGEIYNPADLLSK